MVKDIIESVESRISAPYFGYLFCSFLAINWEALFYLIFAKKTVSERITVFNEQTSFLTTIICPIVLGAILTVASPYLKYWFAKVVDSPVRKKRTLDIMADEAAKRTRKLQEKVDQFEISQAKLAEAEQAIKTIKQEKDNQESALSTAEKQLKSLTNDHDKLIIDFNEQVDTIAKLNDRKKSLDEITDQNIKLKALMDALKDDSKKSEKKIDQLNDQLTASKIEIKHVAAENKSLIGKIKHSLSKHSQYKNLSLLLEQLNKTMMKRDAIGDEIMEYGPGEFVEEDDEIRDRELNKKIIYSK